MLVHQLEFLFNKRLKKKSSLSQPYKITKKKKKKNHISQSEYRLDLRKIKIARMIHQIYYINLSYIRRPQIQNLYLR